MTATLSRVDVKAECAGTFYRSRILREMSAADQSAFPHLPESRIYFATETIPYTEVGQRVIEGQVVGIVEALGVFAGVVSPVTGKVVEIRYQETDTVDRDAVLMIIEPEGG